MKLEQLIQRRIDRLESVPNKLLTAIDANQEAQFKQLLKDLGSLKTKDGKILTTKENLARINVIINNLKNVFLGEDYINAISEFASEIKTQADINNQILDIVVSGFEDDAIYKATIAKSQHNALLLLDENAVAANMLQPIADLLTSSVTTGMSFTDAVEMMRNNLVGENAIYSKYASTVVKDAFAISDRQYVQLTARQHDIVFYRYDGNRVSGSRYFCCVRKGNVYHEDEIRSWGDNPGLWNKPANGAGACSTAHGGGRNDDTNSATIFSFLGGYGCIDVLVPIATEYVPQQYIDRAIQLGYYSNTQ